MAVAAEAEAKQLLLRLDGFEGPLDMLLDVARAQRIDLGRISILSLVKQFLAVVEGAERVRLELAADWLVTAAWLAWLKSRLLLPPEAEGTTEADDAADTLAERLDALAALQDAAAWLGGRPRLGEHVFARGDPEELIAVDRSGLRADLPSLLRAYLAALRRGAAARGYAPRPALLPTMGEALERLRRLLGDLPGWAALERFLPGMGSGSDAGRHRAALAATLLAGLELARSGSAILRQDEAFGPILLRAASGDRAQKRPDIRVVGT